MSDRRNPDDGPEQMINRSETDAYAALVDRGRLRDENEFNVDDEYARQYLAFATGLSLTEESAGKYESRLGHYVDYLLANRETVVMEATLRDVAAFIHHCAVDYENRITTITGKISTICKLYDYIELDSEITERPSVTSRQIKALNVGALQSIVPPALSREALPKEDISRLFSVALPPRDKLMMRVAYETGLRNRDVRTIRMTNIDLDDPKISVEYSKGGKTHTVPMRSDLALEIEHWMGTDRKSYSYHQQSEYLFVSNQGEYIQTNSQFGKIVRNAAEQAGIQDTIGRVRGYIRSTGDWEYYDMYRVTPHTLRHSILTHLQEGGFDDDYRRSFAGHTKLATTLDYYSHGNEVGLYNKIRNALDDTIQ